MGICILQSFYLFRPRLQERVNKTQREAYTEHDRVKKLLEQYHDTYEGQIQSLIRVNKELADNKKAQKDNEKALAAGSISLAQFSANLLEHKFGLFEYLCLVDEVLCGPGFLVERGDNALNSNFGSSLQSLGNSSSGNFLDGMTTKVKAFWPLYREYRLHQIVCACFPGVCRLCYQVWKDYAWTACQSVGTRFSWHSRGCGRVQMVV